MNLLALDSSKFEKLCQALLLDEYPRFQSYSPPDWGMDGYESDSGTIFQAYFPERSPRKDKIHDDLMKARQHGQHFQHWVLLLPKNPSAALCHWLETEEKLLCRFTIDVWGHTKIMALLRKHKNIREEFFPTEERHRIPKGKKPQPGDAEPGGEISADAAAELQQLIIKIAEEEARRKKRRPDKRDYAREYGEFNAHFNLSAYDRLPVAKLAEARVYFERKLYGRRRADTAAIERHRYVSGIKAIQAKLKISDARYREMLVDLTGKTSTTSMELEELVRVLAHFRQLDGITQVQSINSPPGTR